MRILITSLSLCMMLLGCSKDREDSDPCERAISNAARLANQDTAAQDRFGGQPITRARCQNASSAEVSCAAYASSWRELEQCSGNMLR